MRCYECGNRVADGQEECPSCHVALWAIAPAAASSPAMPTGAPQADSFVSATFQGRRDASPTASRMPMVISPAAAVIASVASAAQSALAFVFPPVSSVQGRIIIADAAYSEEPDLDPCRIITRVLWIIMLLPLLVGSAAVCLVFRRLSPINLYATLGVFRFLNPVARNSAQIPVRYFRIREEGSDNEVMLRMKGRLTQGNLGLEDHVTLWGRFHGGTLYAKHGFNHRTASTIRLARSYSWVGLLLTILCILALVVAYHDPTAIAARSINLLGGAR